LFLLKLKKKFDMEKPCPFCCNPNALDHDTGEACCFCDYEGMVSIGKYGMFTDLEQYNKIYFASNHKSRLDELHGRNDNVERRFNLG
jgi:hypothetical protein